MRTRSAARWLGLWATVGLLAACAGSSRGYDSYSPPPAQATTLGPGDTFEVAVYDEKDLSGKYQVADDGTINFPLVGNIAVAGKSPPAVALAIQDALRDKQILRNPSVSIYVAEYASKRISVVGAVQKPGSFPWKSGMSVVQAISLAGGLTPIAAANDTIVTRQELDKPKRYKVAAGRITEGREKDFILVTGDIVFVPERLF